MDFLSSGPGMRPDKRLAAQQGPSFAEALRFWFKLGWISFGGTAAHIAIMQDELVEKKRWISTGMFLHALSHCTLLPGPEAQQLAIYIGWKLHGKRGGIVAGTSSAFLAPYPSGAERVPVNSMVACFSAD